MKCLYAGSLEYRMRLLVNFKYFLLLVNYEIACEFPFFNLGSKRCVGYCQQFPLSRNIIATVFVVCICFKKALYIASTLYNKIFLYGLNDY